MAEHSRNSGRKSKMNVDIELVRELAELLSETGLSEIEVEDGERKLRVARELQVAQYAGPAPQAAPAAPQPQAESAPQPAADSGPDLANAVPSPMVGTVYLAPEPGASDFISVGDKVTEGQTLLIVEAMKVMNPITAPRAGTVRQILVDNAQPVEFDQPLVVID
ncbi:acetyl-CoA carboxylase biotin carboxyl carrier protein [Alteriqipengyuania lutimaris]|uniref:Biotin carboxyl carrier protein of acetyl-CoA carboxylase n=1 Tax=Alteriqipengyuania lutimaris TaxID=1538146 RepID=A0A395LM18_9SPHN|nr:acetyl-CoA carboxylase biotin carboxyl carrier protein [Alteriqipengyuania lutimaris]MBB3033137.1 acetyl-CoA carboxylase biotin carboxyl carrier protein [Alteriqipengyuania lutimaris]RDS77805.1 acetyl-CoA carboxylase biotin carboxyl carrier protein [Alteriqipengyuania lutimaris]